MIWRNAINQGRRCFFARARHARFSLVGGGPTATAALSSSRHCRAAAAFCT